MSDPNLKPDDLDTEPRPLALRFCVGWTLLSLLVLAGLCIPYRHFISDDALISLRYAQRLNDGLGLTWTQGPPVEGYSNLAWVLLCAGLGRLGVDLIVAARLLGIVCMGSVCVALAVAARACPSGDRHGQGLLVAQCFWVCLAPTAVWSMGGLEQPLFVATLVGTCTLLLVAAQRAGARADQYCWGASFLLALHTLTRPDGMLWVLILGLAWLWYRRFTGLGEVLRILFLPLLAFAGQLIFRRIYYGAWVPNTALIKVGPSPRRLGEGIVYVLAGISSAGAILLPAIGWGLFRKRMGFEWGLIVGASVWLAYIAFVGGDIFPAYRHLLVYFGVFALALLCWMQDLAVALQRRFPTWERRGWRGALVLVAPVMGCFAVAQHQLHATKLAQREKWEWNGKEVGELLATAFASTQPTFAVTAAGSLPYFSRLPVIDQLGLNDRYIATHPPPGVGSGKLAHEFGDGAYVLSKKPGIVSFCGVFGSRRPCFVGGRQMVEDPRFQASYLPVALRVAHTDKTEKNGPEPWFHSWLWFRWRDPKVGMRLVSTPDPSRVGVSIPAFLGAQSEDLAAQLLHGKLVLALLPGQRAPLPVPTSCFDPSVPLEIEGPEGLSLQRSTQQEPGQVWIENQSKLPLELSTVTLFGKLAATADRATCLHDPPELVS